MMDFRTNRNFVNNGSKWWRTKCPRPKVKSSGQNDHLIFEKTGEAKKKCSKLHCNVFYAPSRIYPTSHTTDKKNGSYKGIYAPKSTLIHTLFKPPDRRGWNKPLHPCHGNEVIAYC